MSVLAERLIAVDAALSAAGFRHAFGGAIALAYCTEEPRGTRDLDVNVFVGANRASDVLDALPTGVDVKDLDRTTARREGQVRVWWDETPIDVFFNTHEFHREIAGETVEVPFEGITISVLGCESLIVFKAMFNRTKDWADIESILAVGAVNGGRVLSRLRALLGDSDAAVARFASLIR
jgi:predicted nucleotidyltransferase